MKTQFELPQLADGWIDALGREWCATTSHYISELVDIPVGTLVTLLHDEYEPLYGAGERAVVLRHDRNDRTCFGGVLVVRLLRVGEGLVAEPQVLRWTASWVHVEQVGSGVAVPGKDYPLTLRETLVAEFAQLDQRSNGFSNRATDLAWQCLINDGAFYASARRVRRQDGSINADKLRKLAFGKVTIDDEQFYPANWLNGSNPCARRAPIFRARINYTELAEAFAARYAEVDAYVPARCAGGGV